MTEMSIRERVLLSTELRLSTRMEDILLDLRRNISDDRRRRLVKELMLVQVLVEDQRRLIKERGYELPQFVVNPLQMYFAL